MRTVIFIDLSHWISPIIIMRKWIKLFSSSKMSEWGVVSWCIPCMYKMCLSSTLNAYVQGLIYWVDFTCNCKMFCGSMGYIAASYGRQRLLMSVIVTLCVAYCKKSYFFMKKKENTNKWLFIKKISRFVFTTILVTDEIDIFSPSLLNAILLILPRT